MQDNLRNRTSVPAAGETAADRNVQSILVIGCGLIGASFAAALRRVRPSLRIDGIERGPSHRETAAQLGVFDRVEASLPLSGAGRRYDLAVLAVPIEAACALLPQAAEVAAVVMDVCSVKGPICQAAQAWELTAVFAPTHPMAGRAAGGPAAADAELFVGRSWLVLDGFPACDRVRPLLEAVGAVVRSVPTAAEHDAAMAAVSHGVHLASLSTMLAYDEARTAARAPWSRWAGPGFRDVTRLSASPADFWVETLRANRQAVVAHLDRIQAALTAYRDALAADDPVRLRDQLEAARRAHERWRRECGEEGT